MSNGIAAIWARVSSKAQMELSLDSQINEVKPWLESQGWTIPNERILRVTWTSLDIIPCPELQILLEWIRKREIGAIGLYHSDRLSGKPAHKIFILEQCKKHNVKVLSKNSPLFDGREGELIEFVLTWSKEASVLRTQLGARTGLRDRALIKHLPPTQKKAFGYSWNENKFIPNENYDTAKIIWSEFLSGVKTKRICQNLTKRGIPTPRGKSHWAPSSIIAILKNPIYAGRIAVLRYEKVEPKKRRGNTYGKTSTITKPETEWHYLDDLVETPIVTWQQYVAAQDRLKLNKTNAMRNAKRHYLLRGMIECQFCHEHYYGIQRTGQAPAYVCSRSWAQMYGQKCKAKPLACHELELAVKELVRNFLESPDGFLVQVDQKVKAVDYTIGNLTQNIKALESKFEQTIDDERRAFQSLTSEAFQREQSLLKARRTWLSEELDRQKTKLNDLKKMITNADIVTAMRKTLHDRLDRASDEDWRFILEAVGAKVLAFGDGTWDIEINIPDTLSIENGIPRSSVLWVRPPMSPPYTTGLPGMKVLCSKK